MPPRFASALLAILAFTTALYWPGLSGGYLFDDSPNFVDNPDVHVSSLDWRDWRGAALASPSAELRRPLAMLSFAANYYFTQLDPFPVKLVNLAIHLCNGLLLCGMLLELLSLCRRGAPPAAPDPGIRLAALSLTAAWLLAPINLSAVLYAVQRMESLAQAFVLGGLWMYLAGRRRMLISADGRGLMFSASGLVFGSAFGVLCKESAVLLPVYAFLVELAVLRFAAADSRAQRRLWIMYLALLFAPAVIGLAWLLPRTLDPAAYAGRPFTLAQRLLTESRVLIDYMGWTLLPHPASLSFYHDDIAVSRGWLDPPATLGAIGLIGTIILAAAWMRKRLPLFALGVGWYFAAHLLTATVIPLELVFEHRNYFASIGLLLAAGALLTAIPSDFKLLRTILPLCLLCVFAGVTWLRAKEWGDPIRLAYAEAMTHPLSSRASYELGRTLTAASGYRADSKLIDPAMEAFERAAALPHAGASPYAGLIVVAGHMHRPVRTEWWSGLTERLAQQPPSAESIGALESLTNCQQQNYCPPESGRLLTAFLATIGHPAPSGRLLAAYGTFAANQLGDYALAEQAFGDAMLLMPDVIGIRINLIKVLLLEGKTGQAQQMLNQIDGRTLKAADAEQIAAMKQSAGL